MNTLNLDSTNVHLSSAVPSMHELTFDEMDEVSGASWWGRATVVGASTYVVSGSTNAALGAAAVSLISSAFGY